MLKITVNEKVYDVDVPAETPLLWVLREELKLTGTKFGCGKGLCGACTVLMGKSATRSCILPVIAATQTKITTIEGLPAPSTAMDPNSSNLHAVQKAWLEEDVVQCGYCQPGQILTALSLLEATPNPSDQEISQAMSQNLCRCGTYPRIQKAVKRASELIAESKKGGL